MAYNSLSDDNLIRKNLKYIVNLIKCNSMKSVKWLQRRGESHNNATI